jgi:hypothetical protein
MLGSGLIKGGFKIAEDGSQDVNVQDQTTVPFDFFFTQVKGIPTTVAVNVATITPTTLIYDVDVTDASACVVGDYVGIFNADDPLDNRAYFGAIQVISLGGGVGGTDRVTLDTPLDFSFQVGNTFACFTRELDVDGSGTPEIFSVQVGSGATQSIDITRFMVSMYTSSAPNLGLFGNLTSLTNGLVLRRVNGRINNIWNVKNNGELANITFDFDIFTASGQGQDGAKWRNTYAGQDKHGVAIRLEPGDSLQLIIQDNLTALEQFRVIAEGHYVEP